MTIEENVIHVIYPIVPDYLRKDKRLKAPVLRLLTLALNKPRNWICKTEEIAKDFKVNVDTIRRRVNRLIELGYVEKKRVKDKHGRYAPCTARVYAKPKNVRNHTKKGV